MAFKRGHKLAPGGARENSGRPPDWLKNKCQELIDKHKIIEFICDVASGEYTEVVFDGELKREIRVSAKADERLKAANMLLDRGFGKPVQDVRPVDGEGNYKPLVVMLSPQTEGTKGSFQ